MHRPGRLVALPLAVLTVAVLASSGCRVETRGPLAGAPPPRLRIKPPSRKGWAPPIAVIVDTSGSMKDAAARRSAAQVCDCPRGDRADARRDRRLPRQAAGFPDQDWSVQLLQRGRGAACDRPVRSRRGAGRAREAAGARRRHGDRRGDARGASGALPGRRVPQVPAGRDRRREHPRPRPGARCARDIRARATARCRSTSSRSTPAPRSSASSRRSAATSSSAGTGPELRSALDGIYQGKILAEAMDAGERETPRDK